VIPVKLEDLTWIYTSENENIIWLCFLLPVALHEVQGKTAGCSCYQYHMSFQFAFSYTPLEETQAAVN